MHDPPSSRDRCLSSFRTCISSRVCTCHPCLWLRLYLQLLLPPVPMIVFIHASASASVPLPLRAPVPAPFPVPLPPLVPASAPAHVPMTVFVPASAPVPFANACTCACTRVTTTTRLSGPTDASRTPHILSSLIRALLRAKHGLSRRALRPLFISKHTHVFQWSTPRLRHSGVTLRLLSANWPPDCCIPRFVDLLPTIFKWSFLSVTVHTSPCHASNSASDLHQHCFPRMNTRVMHHSCITCHAVTHL